MARTDSFRKQHEELLGIVKEMSALMNEAGLTSDAKPMVALIMKLIGKLTIHLSVEDNSLYPELMKHPDQRIKDMASF